jgi:hypothetical protein
MYLVIECRDKFVFKGFFEFFEFIAYDTQREFTTERRRGEGAIRLAIMFAFHKLFRLICLISALWSTLDI